MADALIDLSKAATPEAAAWCVLGVSRLHHLLATGAMTSKSGAGRHALAVFDSQWQAIIHEALRARESRQPLCIRRRARPPCTPYHGLYPHGDRSQRRVWAVGARLMSAEIAVAIAV